MLLRIQVTQELKEKALLESNALRKEVEELKGMLDMNNQKSAEFSREIALFETSTSELKAELETKSLENLTLKEVGLQFRNNLACCCISLST